jgi:hypothetical protein
MSQQSTPAQQSPDQQVAANIGAALVAAGLLDASKLGAIVAKLASGQMKAADWKSLFEANKPKGGT